MEIFERNCDDSIKKLIEIGMNGHFPLFERDWRVSLNSKSKKFSNNEKCKLRSILKRLAKHKSLERKRTLIFSLAENERSLFVHAFIKTVENKVLNAEVILH